jgi:hypothetical protein
LALAYRFEGKQKLLALGVYPDVPLVLAREHDEAAYKLLATGVDPSENRKAAKATSNTITCIVVIQILRHNARTTSFPDACIRFPLGGRYKLPC